MSEEVEGRVTKILSQEFIRTEGRTLGALSKLNEFLLNPQARVHPGPIPKTSRNSNIEYQGTNEDRFQNDPHPEVGVSLSQLSKEFSREETSDSTYIKTLRKLNPYSTELFHISALLLK